MAYEEPDTNNWLGDAYSFQELLRRNAFCLFQDKNQSEKLVGNFGFQVARKVLMEIGFTGKNIWITEIYRRGTSNHYCNMIGERGMYGMTRNFWQEKCMSMISSMISKDE